MGFVRLATVLVLAVPAGFQAQSVDVDINGPHVFLRASEARDWNDITVELNSYWTFKVPRVPTMKSLCINAVAFTVKPSIRAGRDFEGIHFDPATMRVKTVSASTPNGKAVPLGSVTSGMIKPLTSQEAVWCVGDVK